MQKSLLQIMVIMKNYIINSININNLSIGSKKSLFCHQNNQKIIKNNFFISSILEIRKIAKLRCLSVYFLSDIIIIRNNNRIITNISHRFSNDAQLRIDRNSSKVKIQKHDNSLLTTVNTSNSISKFSPDNQSILTQNGEDMIKLWGMNDREVRLKGQIGRVKKITFSPDGQIIAAIDSDRSIKLWHRNGNLIAILEGHIDEVENIIFSPDSQTLASIGTENLVKLWRTSDGQLIKDLPGHLFNVNQVKFSPDSKMLATISYDNVVKLWKIDGTLIKSLTGHPEQVTQVAFSPDSTIIASVSEEPYSDDKEIRLWQRNGEFIKTIDDFEIRDVFFFPEQAEFASVDSMNTVKFWNFTGKLVKTKIYQEYIQNLSLSSNSQKIVGSQFNRTLKIWHKQTEEPIVTALKDRHSKKINDVIFSPDGETIVSASDDKTVKLWNSNNGELLRTLEGHPDGVTKVSMSDDGEIIRSTSHRVTKIWTKNGELLKTITNNSSGNSLTYDLNAKFLLDSKTQYRLKLWNLDGILQQTFAGHQDPINTATFSPDGTTIASGSDDGTIKLWRVSDGQLIKTIQEAEKDHDPETHAVNSLRFSPDGNYLASGSNDKTVKIWDKDGTLLHTIDEHTEPVKSVAFHPNSKYLASFSEDDTIRFWRTKDGTEIKSEIKEDSDNYDNDSLHFSHDGKYLVIESPSVESVKLHTLNMLDGIWSKEATLPIINDFSDTPLQPGGEIMGTSGHDGMLIFSLGLDDLMERACDQVGDYLKYNPNVKESDKKLCDGIGDDPE